MVLACIETYVKVTQTPLQPAQLTQQKFPIVMLNAVLNNDTGKLMEMRHLLLNLKYTKLWGKSYTKELGQLAQGMSGTKGTDTIVFIRYNKIPLDRRRHITYGKTVVTYRPEKDNPNQTRLTVGGNWIVHHGNVSTPAVEMMTVKMHLNSVISTKGVQYCTFDLKDFYLNMPMEQPEYMRMKLSDLLPQEFVDLYSLTKIAEDNGNVYIKVQKGMYSLLQAGILAHRLLEQQLNEHKYHQSQATSGLWKHALRPISFTLSVNNFWHEIHWPRTCRAPTPRSQHALQVLARLGWQEIPWHGHCLGLQAKKSPCVDVGICPQSINAVPTQGSKNATTSNDPHVKPTYGATCQYAEANNMSELLSKENKTYIQEVIGTFLYYARCVDSSMLPALGTLATQQAMPTKNMMKKIK
jgi:hypothetical protein